MKCTVAAAVVVMWATSTGFVSAADMNNPCDLGLKSAGGPEIVPQNSFSKAKPEETVGSAPKEEKGGATFGGAPMDTIGMSVGFAYEPYRLDTPFARIKIGGTQRSLTSPNRARKASKKE